MATALSPILNSQGLLDMLQQAVPFESPAMDIYRRLLDIHRLATVMNAANDLADLCSTLTDAFSEWMPEDSISLCLIEGAGYRRLHISGPDVLIGEGPFPLAQGIVGSVLLSGTPLRIADVITRNRACAFGPSDGSITPRSAMVLPFMASGKVAGCLEMISSQQRRFDDADYHFSSLVAAHLSSCLESILAREELARAISHLRDRDKQLTELNKQLKELAQTDEATGLFNRRRLLEQLESEVARVRRYGEILSCLMIDIDYFKKVNDCFGHQAGDSVLREISVLLRRSVRVTDFVARYGGEEFTVLLPQTGKAGAIRVAESLRSCIKTRPFALGAAEVSLTISVGVACCSKFDKLDAHQIILQADESLYRAKQSGRDRVCFAENTIVAIPSQEFGNMSGKA